MKLSLSWIKEFIDISASPHQIAHMLTHAGLEVDNFAPLPLNFENVVVGEVVAVEPHPDADKLCVASVTDGKETYQVVCGAPNCRKGLKTAFAMIGAVLSDGGEKKFKIKKTTLRGVESHGMLCAEKELGLGEDEDGIMEFADQVVVGADIAELYADTIFDISLTPNLGHCASVLGVARELSAASDTAVSLPKFHVEENASQTVSGEAAVEVRDSEKCPRYACRMIKNVKVGPSPQWMQKRLLACDFRPVNNIVDITNYVLLEFGHPLHAFDYDRVEGRRIVVRDAEEGEAFTTLDGNTHKLTSDDLLICDDGKAIAVAGVMGGQNSEVSENTHDVLLESAYFEPRTIRRTSKRLGLQTEASKRFERGCDPNNVLRALDRAAALMDEIAGGTVCEGTIDVKKQDFPRKTATCRLSRINALLGAQLSLSEVESVFNKLDMAYTWDGKDLFTVSAPTYRVDISDEVDLIEEVARIYGFENIPKKPPRYSSSTLPHAPIYLFENKVRQRLIAEGLQEFLTCDLIGPTFIEAVKGTPEADEFQVKVMNPTSVEQSLLRTSLLPGLLQVARYNYDRNVHDVSGFEIGRAHFKKDDQYLEQSVAGILLMGKSAPHYWGDKPKDCDFYLLKGLLEDVLQELRVKEFSFEENALEYFHPGRQASIYVDSLEIGSFGEVHPAIVRRLDIPQRIYFAEIDLHDLFKVEKRELILEEIPVYPGSTRDLTVTLGEETPIQEIFDAIEAIPSRLLESTTLTDIFRSEKLGPGKKNVTFHFVYRNKKKTVSQEAVDAEHARITSQIQSQLKTA